LRYFTAGTGPPLVLLHTVRTQLDYFQRVLPALRDDFTVYALDLPGMGWSDVVPGARYGEPELRGAVVEFVRTLGLREATLAGESMGAALALLASIELTDRVSGVIAFNPYDYPGGLERGNWFARMIGTGVRLPGSGAILARLENRTILKGMLAGGFADRHALPKDFLIELRRSGRRPGYPRGEPRHHAQPHRVDRREKPLYASEYARHVGLQRARLVAPGGAGPGCSPTWCPGHHGERRGPLLCPRAPH
jgi:pimeloyl-ACP methyl ester carboxylesterase